MLYPIREALKDMTALGGASLYGIVMLLVLVLGKTVLFVQLLVGIVILYAAIIAIRLVYHKHRPERRVYRSPLERIDASSFPSMHAARAMLLALVVSMGDPLLMLVLGLAALAVAASRVILRKHDLWDALGGVVLGILVAAVSALIV